MRSLASSQAALERTRRVLGNGVASGMRAAMRPHPLFMASGSGSHLTDLDGNDYVDYVLGYGPMLVGHSHPRVVESVEQQLRRGQLFGAGNSLEFEVGEAVLDTLEVFDRLLYSNTGTEAIQTAIRLARAATGRQVIVKFAAAYHGWHDTVYISVTDFDDPHQPKLNSRGQNERVLEDVIILPFNDLASATAVLSAKSNDIAAVVLEGTLTSAGLFSPTPGFLEGIRALCDQIGAVMILDEVVTGFRCSLGGAVQAHGVVPDLAVYAKAIASGFSLSVIAGKSDVVDLVADGVVHAGTYNGNPIALAAAKATLEVLTVPGTHERLGRMSADLADGLRSVLGANGIRAEVRHMPGMVQVLPGAGPDVSPSDFNDLDWEAWGCWSEGLVANGVYVASKGRMFVSTAHTVSDIDDTIRAFDRAV